jgi:uncharacterized small protein (DUF1192 family)
MKEYEVLKAEIEELQAEVAQKKQNDPALWEKLGH